VNADLQPGNRGREHWAKVISEDWGAAMSGWGDTLRGIHRTGLDLETAKAELPHGDWLAMIETDMPFQKTKAENLIAIARSGVCQIPATSGNLPISVNTLYELSRLDENELEAAIKDGRVHVDMTRADAKKLATPETLRDDLKARKKPEPTPHDDDEDDDADDGQSTTPVASIVTKVQRTIQSALAAQPLTRPQRDRLFVTLREEIDRLQALANSMDQSEEDHDA
jgi:hypothetical protein